VASLKVVNVSFNSWFVVKTAKKTCCKVLSIILTIMTTAVRDECVMNYMYYAHELIISLSVFTGSEMRQCAETKLQLLQRLKRHSRYIND